MISDITFGLLGRIFLEIPVEEDCVTGRAWPALDEDTDTRLCPAVCEELVLFILAIILFLAGVERIMLFILMISEDPVTWCGFTF